MPLTRVKAANENIHRLQDQLAAAELDDARQGTNRSAAIQDQLLHMEAEFAKAFPQASSWTTIDCDKIFVVDNGKVSCFKLPLQIEHLVTNLPCLTHVDTIFSSI